ncbi:MAG: glucan biosynthesis protein [Pseudooceanicola sp.]|nr:glucan biosynthesis protein [Pseudooceanicola sp.]
MRLSRRAFLVGSSALGLVQAASLARAGTVFARQMVIDMARGMAARDYAPRETVPQEWLDLTYDQYRGIRFKLDHALWAGTNVPYVVDFFAPGLYFPRTIQVNTVTGGMSHPVPFRYDDFDHAPDLVPPLPVSETLGFAGLRLRTEQTEPGRKSEFCVFQGASYFRAIGYGHTYGLSARGLALRTGDPMGEEFPDFIRFWLETPAPGERNIIVHALLDSPSVTGAYRFDIAPGPDCVMEVEATLFPRNDLDHVGLGPLTSMFLFDETNRTRFDDFRPAVHDSDGLMIWNGADEVIWRPLANPRTLQVSQFVDRMPRGFGLMQRARKLSDYADLEAHYHQRPGVWVEPKGDWGAGSVTLVEIPADKEIYDNIVAYWRPRDPILAGENVEVAYRLTWCAAAPVATGLPRVLNTRMGAREGGGRLVTIDFESSDLLSGDPEGIEISVSSPQAQTKDAVLQKNPETGGLRLAFTFDAGDAAFAELRAALRKDGAPASEVWLYRWTR